MPNFDRAADRPFWQEYAPEGSIPVGFMACIQYVDPDSGESRFQWVVDSDEIVTACIGQLEIHKSDLIQQVQDDR